MRGKDFDPRIIQITLTNGELITNTIEVLNRWVEHFGVLLNEETLNRQPREENRQKQ